MSNKLIFVFQLPRVDELLRIVRKASIAIGWSESQIAEIPENMCNSRIKDTRLILITEPDFLEPYMTDLLEILDNN